MIIYKYSYQLAVTKYEIFVSQRHVQSTYYVVFVDVLPALGYVSDINTLLLSNPVSLTKNVIVCRTEKYSYSHVM